MKRTTTPFKFLAKVSNESILYAIQNEHPQTMAVIMSFLSPAQAAYIIDSLPPERQLAVIKRMAYIGQIELAVIKIIEEEIKMQLADKKYVKTGGIDNIAEVLTVIDQGTSNNILENLTMDDIELVKTIKQSMRVVKTIQKFDKNGKITVNR